MEEKMCNRCKIIKSHNEFITRRYRSGSTSLRGHCKECQRKAQLATVNKYKSEYVKRAKIRRKTTRKNRHRAILEYFITHPCVDCGESDPVVLDFDHIGDKTFAISSQLEHQRWERILLEIAKCEVRCSNCHRRKTAKERGYFRWDLTHQ